MAAPKSKHESAIGPAVMGGLIVVLITLVILLLNGAFDAKPSPLKWIQFTVPGNVTQVCPENTICYGPSFGWGSSEGDGSMVTSSTSAIEVLVCDKSEVLKPLMTIEYLPDAAKYQVLDEYGSLFAYTESVDEAVTLVNDYAKAFYCK